MKKFIVFIAAALSAFCLCACSNSKEYTQFESEKIATAEEYALTQVIPALGYFSDGTMDMYELQYQPIPWDEFTMDEVAAYAKQIFKIEVDGYGFYNAINSFKSSKETVGAISLDAEGNYAYGDVSSYIDGDQIVVNVPVKCDNGDANIEVIFSNDLFMTVEAASINQNSTMSEKMGKAGLNTLLGMGTVFVVLILISLIISLFGLIPKIQKASAEKKKLAEAAKEERTQGIDNAIGQIIANETENEADDTELVAVIAAAIAAYEGTSSDGFVVRSIRRRYR